MGLRFVSPDLLLNTWHCDAPRHMGLRFVSPDLLLTTWHCDAPGFEIHLTLILNNNNK